MIKAGLCSQIIWESGIWVFLDIGFSRDARSCGVLEGDGNPQSVQFGEAKKRIVSLAKAARGPVNLVIEAPLSVCFNAAGNPKGRSIEKEGSKTRYWYYGVGCAVMVAATYLVANIWNNDLHSPVRLFEGFVSYKDRLVVSDHERDVLLLREVVRAPDRFKDSIFSPDQLKQDSTDDLFSAFRVAGYDCGIPPVIKR
jgi:hypothetical protein